MVYVIKVCSNGGAIEIIAKVNLKIANLMQIFENRFLQGCSMEFLDVTHKWWCHLH